MSHSSGPTVRFVWAQFTIYQCEWKVLCSSLSLCCFWRLMDWPQLKSCWLCVECSVCLWHVKVFQNRLFSRRLGQQAAVTVKGLSLFFGQEDTRHLCERVVSSARASLCACVHQFICVLQESEVFVWLCEWRVMGSRHAGASNANKAAEPQNYPASLWLYRASVLCTTNSNRLACGFIANVKSVV